MQTLYINFDIAENTSRSVEVILNPSPEGVIPVMYKGSDYRSAVDFMLAISQLDDTVRNVEKVLIYDLKIDESISYLTHRVMLHTEYDEYGGISSQEYRLVEKTGISELLKGINPSGMRYKPNDFGEGFILTEKGESIFYLVDNDDIGDNYYFAETREGQAMTIRTLNKEWLEYYSIEEEYKDSLETIETTEGTFILPSKK